MVGVTDGDTVTVLDASRETHKIRLAGIDSPEKKQPFGGKAKQSLSTLLYAKPVQIEWAKRDRYGRIIGKVLVARAGVPCPAPPCANEIDAGLAQIEAGLAWHYKKYEKEQSPEDREAYALAETEARSRRNGLWADPDPMPPWEWRHR